MKRFSRTMALATFVASALLGLNAGSAQASLYTYQTVNATLSPAPFFWGGGDVLGWYWTPATNVLLNEIDTKLATGFNNINNNYTFTTTLYTDRPFVGGTSLGAASWNGTSYNSNGWLGSAFSSPISLTGGTTYFIGFSGFQQAFNDFGGSGGSGVNWINPGNQSGAQSLGAGSAYLGTDYMTQANPSLTPQTNIDSPILLFTAVDQTPPPNGVPEPGSLTVWALGLVAFAGINWRKHKRTV
jgi:hypothetical protein